MFALQAQLLNNIITPLETLRQSLVQEDTDESRKKLAQIDQLRETVIKFSVLLLKEPKEEEKILYPYFLGELNNEITNIEASLQELKILDVAEQKKKFQEILIQVHEAKEQKLSALNSAPVDTSGLQCSIEPFQKPKVSSHSSSRKYSLTAAQKQACVTLAGSLFLGAAVTGIGIGVKVFLGSSVLTALAFMWPLAVAVAATALFVGLGVLLWKNDLFPGRNFLEANLGI